jgi:hypothetical protein
MAPGAFGAIAGGVGYTEAMRPLLITALLLATDIRQKSIYSTSPQAGMQRASGEIKRDGSFVDTFGRELNELKRETKSGASNVFLVEAKGIDGAVMASRFVLAGLNPVGKPARVYEQAGDHWLVVYLGTSHSGPAWELDSVKVDGNRIRFAYHLPRAGGGPKDLHPYFYWVPLGELKPGKYQLELFDGEDVTLMRRVEVRAAQQ